MTCPAKQIVDANSMRRVNLDKHAVFRPIVFTRYDMQYKTKIPDWVLTLEFQWVLAVCMSYIILHF